jgi:hypothetical protein
VLLLVSIEKISPLLYLKLEFKFITFKETHYRTPKGNACVTKICIRSMMLRWETQYHHSETNYVLVETQYFHMEIQSVLTETACS